jgi:hypothetical protein
MVIFLCRETLNSTENKAEDMTYHRDDRFDCSVKCGATVRKQARFFGRFRERKKRPRKNLQQECTGTTLLSELSKMDNLEAK